MNAHPPKWLWLSAAFMVACAPGALLAAQHSDAWCADAALYSLQSLGQHDTHAAASHNIDTQFVSLQQQYPALSQQDLHRLTDTAFKHHLTPFGAARAAIQSCTAARKVKPAAYTADYLAGTHSESWCAAALDFAIGTAGYRDMGQTQGMSQRSVKSSAHYYAQMYPELKQQDLLDLIHSVFAGKWSRFDAANAITTACKVAPKNAPKP